MFPPSYPPFKTNRLLAALPEEDYQRILPSLEPISLKIRDDLYELNEIIQYVYFPMSGMASILVSMGDGTMSEAGIVGNEGMIGLPVFLGAEKTPTKSFIRLPGTEIRRNGALVSILQRYTLAYQTMLAQNSACNSQHKISQRCARWLLLTHDRVGKDQFELTQEFLGQMLGVRREGVNSAMRTLQTTHAIHYSRGMMTIVDRAKVEQAVCECYGIITREYDHMLDTPG